MSGPYLVDNYTGLITSPLSGSLSVRQLAIQKNKRYFENLEEAKRYSEQVIAQHKDEAGYEIALKSEIWENRLRGPFAFFFIFYLILKPIYKLFSKFIFPKCKAAFQKNTKIKDRIEGVIVIILLFIIISYGSILFYNKFLKIKGYVTTKISVLEYSNKESDPTGKEIGKIADDVVLKIENISKANNSTWLRVYKLENNQPVLTWILLPKVVKITEDNEYLIYNEKSRTWNSYYETIDNQNLNKLAEIQKEFKESISSIKINYCNDISQKESLKSTFYILPKKGYLGLYKSGETDLYYLNRNEKDEFLNKVKNAEKKYENTKIKYFSNESKLKKQFFLD